MGEQRITLGMLDSILGVRFELQLYGGENADNLRHVIVYGPKKCVQGSGLRKLCKRIGLDMNTPSGSLYQGIERNDVTVMVYAEDETLDRVGRMVLDGEIPGAVSKNWAEGGGEDETGTV